MIGAALNEVQPSPARSKPFVIGAAQPRFNTRPAVPRNDDGFVIGAAERTGGQTSSVRKPARRPAPRQLSKPTGRRNFVVVGLRHDKI